MLTQEDLEELNLAQKKFQRATREFAETKDKFKYRIEGILNEYAPKKYYDFIEDFEISGDDIRIDLGNYIGGSNSFEHYTESINIPLKVILDSDYANRYKTYLELKKEFGK